MPCVTPGNVFRRQIVNVYKHAPRHPLYLVSTCSSYHAPSHFPPLAIHWLEHLSQLSFFGENPSAGVEELQTRINRYPPLRNW